MSDLIDYNRRALTVIPENAVAADYIYIEALSHCLNLVRLKLLLYGMIFKKIILCLLLVVPCGTPFQSILLQLFIRQ